MLPPRHRRKRARPEGHDSLPRGLETDSQPGSRSKNTTATHRQRALSQAIIPAIHPRRTTMRCNNKTLLGAWLAPLALGAAGAPPALAQDAIVLEEITVTGSRIARDPNLSGALPVQSVDQEQIQMSGGAPAAAPAMPAAPAAPAVPAAAPAAARAVARSSSPD